MATLSRTEARRFYDRLGAGQDEQSWYEDPPIAALTAQARFEAADAVFELGCGTGRFAEGLLGHHLDGAARYHGIDLSPRMAELAATRLAPYAPRATVVCTDGEPCTGLPAATFDRFVATYVLDLLPGDEIRAWLAEAARLVAPGGRLCVAGLGQGRGPVSRTVAGAWALVHRLRPAAVGGCRPLAVARRLDRTAWSVEYHATVAVRGIPSEVVVARRR